MGIKAGKISAVFPDSMSVRVTYTDQNDTVTGKLPIMCRGAGKNYDYWLPDVGEQVIVAETDGDGKGSDSEAFVLGSYYSEAVPPEAKDINVRRIKFANGDYIEHNRSTGDLKIICSGEITINGKKIKLN